MPSINEEKGIKSTQYKMGAVTYEVTAHFHENGEDVSTKLQRLLKADIHNRFFEDTIANGQMGALK